MSSVKPACTWVTPIGVLLLCALGASGCFPVREQQWAYAPKPGAIKVGETTKVEVIDRAWPEQRTPDGRFFVYYYEKWTTWSLMPIGLGGTAELYEKGLRGSLLIEFDHRGIVKQTFVHPCEKVDPLCPDEAGSALLWPWLEEVGGRELVAHYGRAQSMMESLHAAARRSDVDEVKRLIGEGIGVNAQRQDGYTALHLAAAAGHTALVAILLAEGADLNIRAEYGKTPLHVAAEAGQLEVVELLLDKGADIDAKDRYGQTPLHLAAREGRAGIVEVLLRRGAAVNVKDKDGRTPLASAKRWGANKEVIELLKQRASNK